MMKNSSMASNRLISALTGVIDSLSRQVAANGDTGTDMQRLGSARAVLAVLEENSSDVMKSHLLTFDDIELLNRAAQSIGGLYDSVSGCITFDLGQTFEPWCPLYVDQDAFQLSATLKISLHLFLPHRVIASASIKNAEYIATENYTNDSAPAARRAITKVAANLSND